MKKRIELAAGVLVGKVLWKWGRASNMAIFDFGRKVLPGDTQGNNKTVGEWALDIQCSWRIAHQDQVIVGSRDVYYPEEYKEGKIIPDEFDWEHDPNLRDKLLGLLFEGNTREFLVQEIVAAATGDLRIGLDGNLSLELFVDDSSTAEHWRLFEVGKPGHFVVKGSGILSPENPKGPSI